MLNKIIIKIRQETLIRNNKKKDFGCVYKYVKYIYI